MTWSNAMHWLLQPHVYVTAAVVAILLWEHWLSRTKKISSNSTLELAGNALVAFGRLWIPGVQAELAPAEAAIAKVEQVAIAPKPPAAGYARPPVLLLVAAAGAVMFAIALAGCGMTALELAQKTQTAADQVQASAAQAFPVYDKAAEQAILDKGRASGLSDTQIGAQLATRRVLADKLVATLSVMADASHAVKIGLDAVGAGKLQVADVAPLLGKLFAVAVDLQAQAKVLGWTIPGMDKILPANAFTTPPPTSRRLSRRFDLAVA